jgi:hypothetical protein
MPVTGQPRPRVSRETRLLLTTVVISLATLWVLARIRFPERPPTVNPVPTLLTQLAPDTGFEALARTVFQLEADVLPWLVVTSVEGTAANDGGNDARLPGASLRFRDDAAVTLMKPTPGSGAAGGRVLARDAATGLAIVRTASAPALTIRTWMPQRLDYPRYVMVTQVLQDRVSLRPAFLGPLRARPSAAWSEEIWSLPLDTDVPSGAFVFTTTGALMGLIVGQPDAPALVPATVVIATAHRLLSEDSKPTVSIGVDVQALTGLLRLTAGVTSGVVVTWVDPTGPAAGKLAPTDVILAVGGQAIDAPDEWQARLARLTAGAMVTLRIHRGDKTEQVEVLAAAPRLADVSSRLGLTMRHRPRTGAEVVRIDEGSVGMRAGLRVGDVVTSVGGSAAAPTPAQVSGAFASSERGVLVAVRRGAEHHVLALVKP